MSSSQKKNPELDQGAVLVTDGRYKGQIGFYCLQNQQLFDVAEIEKCQECRLEQGELLRLTTNFDSDHALKSAIEYSSGQYCEPHKIALANHDMAVVYWYRPYGEEQSLVHPSKLMPISSIEYARYQKTCQTNADEAFANLLVELGLSSMKVC